MNIHDIPPKAGKVTVVRGKSATKLKLHQAHALKALNKKIQGRQNFGGLLVMPTGSGKTFTAAYWLLKNVINNNVKLLWIAHRHQLLDQALETFINNAYSDIIPDRTSFQYRIVSGLPDHDKPVNVEARDDLVVASKDSFQKSQFDYLLKNWIDGQDEIFLVVDEAHHATAKTYRFICYTNPNIGPGTGIIEKSFSR
jgi:ATP-dependent helicase IRC3